MSVPVAPRAPSSVEFVLNVSAFAWLHGKMPSLEGGCTPSDTEETVRITLVAPYLNNLPVMVNGHPLEHIAGALGFQFLTGAMCPERKVLIALYTMVTELLGVLVTLKTHRMVYFGIYIEADKLVGAVQLCIPKAHIAELKKKHAAPPAGGQDPAHSTAAA